MRLVAFLLPGIVAMSTSASASMSQIDIDTDSFRRFLTGATDSIASELNPRSCNEVIGTVMPGTFPPNLAVPQDNLNYVINALIQGIGALYEGSGFFTNYYKIFLEAVGRDSNILYNAAYGLRAVKVCGQCDDYGLKDTFLRDSFDKYCGEGVYGRDATFSGVALIPVDDGGKPLEGAKKGIVSTLSIQTDGFQVASVQWPPPNPVGVGAMLADPGFFINLVPAMMAVATGKYVGLVVDNMGFGESIDCFKGTFVRKAYQTPALPLWLATQDLVADMSGCKTQLTNKAIVNGYSEGGFGALAVAEALDGIGVDIILAQSGAPANVDAAISETLGGINDSNLESRFSYTIIMVGSSYSSSRPDLPNFGIKGQGVLSDNFRTRAIAWALANLRFSEMRLLTNDALDQVAPVVNPLALSKVAENGLICADDSGLELLCDAIAENQVLDDLSSINYPVEICHSTNDDLIPFNTDIYSETNPQVSLKPSLEAWKGAITFPPNAKNIYRHDAAFAPCLVTQGWTAVDDATPAEMSGKCTRNKKSRGKGGGTKRGKK